MIIKASRRSALMVVTGLFVCVAGAAYTNAASEAASSKSESATETKSAKHSTRHWKRYAHRKDIGTAQKSSDVKKADEKEVADAAGEMPVSLPPEVANANARIDAQLDEPSGATKAMTERANAILVAQADPKPADASAAVPAPAPAPAANPAAPPDQLNEADRALQETAPASQQAQAPAPGQTVAMATTAIKAGPPAQQAAASNDSSTWDQTSLIGKIFIAFGALLTIASAARMFMA
jgi:hypothetical protein